MNTAKSYSATW